ncbi:MAG TPA: DUF4126 domain-containing protein [Pirellulaceae bacterium]|nr:DUF4126 domain-containing protein [Pirellulaceae bacterium]
MELGLSICLGLGLSAACGFRVFVPMLGISTAALAGHLHLAYGFEWLGTWPAFACFLTATILEIAAYYVPWLDNLLDSIATPAAVIAGTLATASVITDMSPLLKWTLAIIAGGGIAGVIQSATVLVRGGSTLSTGGATNWLVATAEWIAALCGTVLSMLLPILAVGLAALVVMIAFSILARFRRPPTRAGQMAGKAA